jgi:hypothetical protein
VTGSPQPVLAERTMPCLSVVARACALVINATSLSTPPALMCACWEASAVRNHAPAVPRQDRT